jgi:hypothetical protein
MKQNEKAFTRVDLLALVGIAIVLTLLALPAFGKSATGSEAVICQNNHRQLTRAWHLYAGDNGEYFPPVSDFGTATTPPSTWVSGDVASAADSTNIVLLTNSTSALAPYIARNHRVFKCPADPGMANATLKIPRVRSVAINPAVGTKSIVADGDGKRATDGAWLDGNHTHIANTVFGCYSRLSDVIDPKPAKLFIFIDQHPTSINDAVFAMIGPGVNRNWIDWPSAFHQGAAGISYMDGHADFHVWEGVELWSHTRVNVSQSPLTNIQWLAQRTTARIASGP